MIPQDIIKPISQGKQVFRLEWFKGYRNIFSWNMPASSINDPRLMEVIKTKCFLNWSECRVYNITLNPDFFNAECKGLLGVKKLVKKSDIK